MITDARVLREEYLPNEIVHRHREMNQLTAAFEPITNGRRGEHAFLYGPSGAGKTTVAKAVVDEL